MTDANREQQAEALIAKMKAVSAKVREFVAIALLCFRGAERAPAELFEVLEACVVPGGAPTFHRGLGALMEVVDGAGKA